jgi:hypothetical protein
MKSRLFIIFNVSATLQNNNIIILYFNFGLIEINFMFPCLFMSYLYDCYNR